MKRSIRAWAASIGVVLMAAGGVALMASAPAQAADSPNTLTFTPATAPEKGDVLAPKVLTAGPCPAAADEYVAFVTGPGLFTSPVLITAPSDVDLSHDEPFPVQLGNSLLDLTKDLGGTAVEPGYYQVTVVCRDKFSQQAYATFAGWMHFTTATSYVTGPGVFPSSTGEPSASASTSASASASATPSATATTEPTADPTETTEPTTEPTTTAPTTPAATATTTTAAAADTLPKTGPPAAGLFALGVVLIIMGGSFVLGTMRFDRPRPARW